MKALHRACNSTNIIKVKSGKKMVYYCGHCQRTIETHELTVASTPLPNLISKVSMNSKHYQENGEMVVSALGQQDGVKAH